MEEIKKKKVNIKKMIIKAVGTFIVLALLLVGTFYFFKALGLANLTQEEVQDKIASYGVWGPLVFIALSFFQVTFVPIPSAVTILAGSFLFGPWLSYLYSLIGILLGSIVAFYLGRLIGKRFVYWIVGDKETVDYYLTKLKGKETVLLFFMFLLPAFPDDALCSIAGIMPISFTAFLIMQVITRVIGIGGTLFFMSGEVIPYHGWGLALIIIIGIMALVAFFFAFKYSDQIHEKLISFVDKHFKKKKKDSSN